MPTTRVMRRKNRTKKQKWNKQTERERLRYDVAIFGGLSLDFKEKNRKAKKLLSYFYVRKKLFYETVKTARIVPFCRISSILSPQTSLRRKTPRDYEEAFKFCDFRDRQTKSALSGCIYKQPKRKLVHQGGRHERDARDLNRRDSCLKMLSAHRFWPACGRI